MEQTTQQKNRHGMSKHSLYFTWKHMCRSCYDPNYTAYRFNSNIKVCERWLDVRNFIADICTRQKGKYFARKDQTKDYSLDNCEWITLKEVMRRRVTVKLTEEAVAEIRINKKNNSLDLKYFSKKFKCSTDTISRAANNHSWN